MKVLLICLALVATTLATTPCFPVAFASSNFAAVDNLLCKAAAPFEFDGVIYGQNCTEYSLTGDSPSFVTFLTRCDADYTTIGYDEFECDLDTGVFSSDIVDSAVLSIHSSCVLSTDLTGVCQGTNVANDDKLLMDVTNAAVQGVNDSSIVYYSLSCDSGYSFADGVDSSSVYGYCNDASVAYTFHADSDSAGCFAKCPANPTASLISDAIDNLESLVLAESANGAVQSAEVVCSSGFDTADGAAESYDFTCEGLLADNADEGSVTCGDSCPVCIATCPADATPAFINDAADNLASLSNAQAKSGEVFSAEPVCDDGFALADDAESSYDYVCSSSINDTADGGMITCDDSSCPVCLAKCAANTAPEGGIDGMASLIIPEGVANEEVVGEVACDSDSAIAWEDLDTVYKFTCSPSADDGADEGAYVCGVDHACPVCESKCEIEANDELDFVYIDGTTPSGLYAPGHDHIEASCKNSSLSLIGERYASCSNGSLSFEVEAPVCADGDVCEHPAVTNAYLTNSDNVLAGEKYTIICDEGYTFDSIDAEIYGSYTEAVVSCRGMELADMVCYAGCGAPDIIGGSVQTGAAGAGQAAYEEGAEVVMKCDGSVISGSETAVCEMGVVSAPVCGACNMAATSLLLVAALFYLLF